MPGNRKQRGAVDVGGSHADPDTLAHVTSVLQRLHREAGAPPAMDQWLDALDGILARFNMTPPPHLEPLLFEAALPVLARRPAHSALPLWHARALAHLRTPTTADTALRAANFAFEYSLRSGNFRVAREIVEQARMHIPAASVQVRLTWLEAEALEAWLSGDHRRAYEAVREALAHGGGYGAWEQGASAALSCGDLARADECLAAMRMYGNGMRAQDVAHASFLSAARARLAGDVEATNVHMDACLAVDSANVPAYFTTLWQLGRVYADVASRKYRRAARDILAVVSRATTHYWGFLHFSALIARAWLKVRMERPDEAAIDLNDALALAHAHGYRTCDPWWDPEAMSDLAELAVVGAVPDREPLRILTQRALP